jgi:hypothetical protein
MQNFYQDRLGTNIGELKKVPFSSQCFIIKRGLPLSCYPEALHDSGVKGGGRICSPLYHSQDQTPEHLMGRKECIKDCDCHGVPCGECESDSTHLYLEYSMVTPL